MSISKTLFIYSFVTYEKFKEKKRSDAGLIDTEERDLHVLTSAISRYINKIKGVNKRINR